MNSQVCVDANIIVWSLVTFPLSRSAEALLRNWRQTGTILIAPTLLKFEVTSTLRRLVYQRVLTAIEGEDAFAAFLKIEIQLSSQESIFPLAWELAKQFNRSRAYNTAYLALAQLNQCDLWTADEKLYNAVHAKLPWVKWLGNF